MKQVTAYVHSHWDREWYREFEDFRLRLIEVFNEVLQAIEKGELPCFYFDGQTAAIEDYLEIHSEKLDIIKKLIKEKKLRIGPFYCSADSLLVSGECLYRNLEIGINKSKELGETEFIGYLPDTFGHSKCIPYILKAFGIDKACLWRGLGDLPADLLWDNIKVTNLIQGYFQDFFNINVNAEEKSVMLKKYLDKIARKSADNVLLPIGADHLAVPDNIKEQITALNKIYTDYEIKLESPFEYFEKINKREQVSGEFLENKSNFILPGVYSSRIYIKQANAKSQWLLSRIAEPLQALGNFFYNTLDKQNEIDYAYKTLIKNHAHDSIYGCSIDKVHDEVMIRYEKVNSVANGIVKRTLRDLSSECNNLAVINLSNFDYSGCVMVRTHKKLPKWMRAVRISSEKGFCDEKLYNINEIPITEDITNIHTYLVDMHNIKAFSVHKITKSDICIETYIKFNTNFVENKHVRIEVINKKIQITDKINNKIYDDFIEITDRADIGDSYNFGALKNDSEITAELVNYKLKEKNSIRAILNLIYKINIPYKSSEKGRSKKTLCHKLNINAILYNQSKYIEFEIDWQNKSLNHILQINFRLKEKIYSTISEDLFGTVKRKFNPDFNIYTKIPAKKGTEIKPNTSVMQRFVYVQGIGIITKGNNEYEINTNKIGLTLLRSTGIISNPNNPTRGTPAGPPLTVEKLQCSGKNTANFAIVFEQNEKLMFQYAEEFYNPFVTLFTKKSNNEFIEIQNKNILVYAIKNTKEGILFRLFNNSKKEQSSLIKISNSNQNYTYTLMPFEIKNIVIKNKYIDFNVFSS